MRHIIMQTICRVLARYYVLIQRTPKPLVGADLYIRPQYIVLAYNIICHLIHENDYYVAHGGRGCADMAR